MKKDKLELDQKIAIFMSMIVLFSIYLFFFVVHYYQMPIGDDVLFRYKDSFYFYTKTKEWHPVDIITSLPMMFEEIWNRWLLFSGRFTTVFFVPFMNVLGEKICAIVGAGVWLGLVLSVARIAFGSWKSIFFHPFALLFVFIYQFVLSSTSTYMVMWTFVCHYGMPTLLCLLYYIGWSMLISKEHVSGKRLACLNVLGLVLGASHELLPMFCFILVGIRSLIIYKHREKRLFYLCYVHTGIFIGYLFCVLAPGNLVRMGIEHDILRTQTGLVDKMLISLKAHAEAMGFYDKRSLVFLAIGIIWLIVSLKEKGVKEYLKKNVEFICACFASVILWGVVAPPVPPYGLTLWKAMLIICLIQEVDVCQRLGRKYFIITMISFALCAYGNLIWCKDLVSVTSQRRELISEAHNNGEGEIVVPKYPESTNNYITGNNIANDENRYYDEIYTKYYDIIILPK